MESSSANISEQAVELAKQKAELDKALNKLVESDATVSALKSQLEILRIQFDSAKGSDEIEALHLKISKVMADLEVAKQSAAAAEESEELAALQKKIEDLQTLSETIFSVPHVFSICNIMPLEAKFAISTLEQLQLVRHGMQLKLQINFKLLVID